MDPRVRLVLSLVGWVLLSAVVRLTALSVVLYVLFHQ